MSDCVEASGRSEQLLGDPLQSHRCPKASRLQGTKQRDTPTAHEHAEGNARLQLPEHFQPSCPQNIRHHPSREPTDQNEGIVGRQTKPTCQPRPQVATEQLRRHGLDKSVQSDEADSDNAFGRQLLSEWGRKSEPNRSVPLQGLPLPKGDGIWASDDTKDALCGLPLRSNPFALDKMGNRPCQPHRPDPQRRAFHRHRRRHYLPQIVIRLGISDDARP